MKSCLRCLVLSGMVLVFAGCPSSVSNTVFGVVADAAGAPICGALVVLESEDETRDTFTGENGDFRFDLVDPGVHSVQVVGAIGYAPSEALPVTIEDPGSGSGRPPALEFILVPGESAGGEICEPDNGGCAGAKGSFWGKFSRQIGDLLSLGTIMVLLVGLHPEVKWNRG